MSTSKARILIVRLLLTAYIGSAASASPADPRRTGGGRARRDRTRVLGADHPDTVATPSNLAHWRGEGGDVAGDSSARGTSSGHAGAVQELTWSWAGVDWTTDR